jgi:hypothetical protein
MDISNLTGIAGSLVLVTGAAWPSEKVKKPIYSFKNWLFLIGGLIMLGFSALNYYLNSAPFFFIIFELFIAITGILMMADTDDRLDMIIVCLASVVFIIWSLYLFEGYSTLIFILGLSITGLGYTFEMETVRRSSALAIGSLLIAIFSYITASWLFFWLNLFFSAFSAYYIYVAVKKPPHRIQKRTHRLKH